MRYVLALAVACGVMLGTAGTAFFYNARVTQLKAVNTSLSSSIVFQNAAIAENAQKLKQQQTQLDAAMTAAKEKQIKIVTKARQAVLIPAPLGIDKCVAAQQAIDAVVRTL